MQNKGVLTIVCDKKTLNLPIGSILYVTMEENNAFIHTSSGDVYRTRMTLSALERLLDDRFIKVKRGTLVSVMAIHEITEKVNLINGESLDYAHRDKKELLRLFHGKQAQIIHNFSEATQLNTEEEYHEHYKLFDSLPIAFCDIEMVFDGAFSAVDWIFRYGNAALAQLEKVPLDKMLGNTFGSLFPNMDPKWLRTYERAALFGETLKIVDYSPEIDAYLDIICFPTFKGHCGCILFDVSKITSYRKATDAEKAMVAFFNALMKSD